VINAQAMIIRGCSFINFRQHSLKTLRHNGTIIKTPTQKEFNLRNGLRPRGRADVCIVKNENARKNGSTVCSNEQTEHAIVSTKCQHKILKMRLKDSRYGNNNINSRLFFN